MSKKQTPAAEPVAAVAEQPQTPAAEPVAAVAEQPQTGGCWIRNPDGSLSRDPAEHREENKLEEQAS